MRNILHLNTFLKTLVIISSTTHNMNSPLINKQETLYVKSDLSINLQSHCFLQYVDDKMKV